ncbi:MAG: M55 family metallopeptidase [Rectinema sp.]|nr:M55 family metallopeptidase [Rectinema sp.]
MKIFISVDMEGIHGAVSWSDMEGNGRQAVYENAWHELSWIIKGITTSNRNSEIEEICICDSHSRGEGIPLRGFGDSRVTMVRGYPRPFYMLEGLDRSYELLMLVGYHGRIGALHGMMDHTYSSSAIYRILINDSEVSEADINAMLAAWYGVPVGFVSGDDVLEREIMEHFPVCPIFVRTKEGLGRFAGKMFLPEKLELLFVEGARQAIESIGFLKPVALPEAFDIKIELISTVVADAVSVIPGLMRQGGRTIEYMTEDMPTAYRMIHAVAMMGSKFASYL